MLVHILLTEEIERLRPTSCNIKHDFGLLKVQFDNGEILEGKHCIIDGEEDSFWNWLSNFDHVPIGNGIPKWSNHKKN